MLNKLDPRIDSDLDNRAQYTPGLTSSGNIHPGVQQTAYNPVSSNDGPHDSWIMNKLDPRVDSTTGIMTSKTTNGTGTGSARAPTDTSGVGIATTTDAYPYSDGEGYHSDYDDGSSTRVRQGSSTGAPGAAITEDARNIYDPRITRYNPATGSGYPAPGSTSDTTDDYSGHIDGSRNADQGAKAGRAGEKRPSRMSRTKSGIHVSCDQQSTNKIYFVQVKTTGTDRLASASL